MSWPKLSIYAFAEEAEKEAAKVICIKTFKLFICSTASDGN